MFNSRLLRGTLLLTGASFLSKFLGMIYIIPFYNLVGKTGGALFLYAYVPYTILLSTSTMGVPLAVSKFVSKYNTLGDYQTGRRLFKSGLLLMSISGLISCLLLFAIAPKIAPLVIGDNVHGNNVEDVTYVIRMVSTALLIVPMMSLIRGFFQGHESMGPTAVSQVIEQIVRIGFLLTGSFLVIKVFQGEISTAVGLSTFAAFVGALGGLAVLVWYWFKRKDHLNELLEKSTVDSNLSLSSIYKELFTYAGPFVFVGLAIPLYQLVDTFTFNKAMLSIGIQNTEDYLSDFNMYAHKLVMIPVSLATAFALTLVPTITKSFTENNKKLLNSQINLTFQVIMFLILPAVIGLSVIAYPAYGAFFSVEGAALGAPILRWYAPVAILFAFFSVSAAILQGINQQKFAVINLFAGLLLKLILNVPLIKLFGTYGAILATTIGFVTAIGLNFRVIKKYGEYSFSIFLRRSLLIILFVIGMSLVVMVTKGLLSTFITFDEGRLQSFIIVLVSIAAGAAFYLWLGIKTGLASLILGHRFTFLERFTKKKEKK